MKPFCLTAVLSVLCGLQTVYGAALPPDYEPTPMPDCPHFAQQYSECFQVSGEIPQFFASVRIERESDHFVFRTLMLNGETLVSRYYPDRLVREAEDFHRLDDGSMIRIPSHESAHCSDNQIRGLEVGFLPDGSVTRENFSIRSEQDADFQYVHFAMLVNGADTLQAYCRQPKE